MGEDDLGDSDGLHDTAPTGSNQVVTSVEIERQEQKGTAPGSTHTEVITAKLVGSSHDQAEAVHSVFKEVVYQLTCDYAAWSNSVEIDDLIIKARKRLSQRLPQTGAKSE